MRVLLSGYYGFGNLGDEALLQGLAHGLRARGFAVDALSGDPAATRALHGVDARHRYRSLLSAVLRADAIVSGGGGLLQDRTSRRSLDYYLGVLELARWTGRRRLVYAQSIGPLSAGGARRVARALRGVPVAVRDGASQELLAALGVAAERVGDPALLLDPPAPAAGGAPQGRPVLLIPRAGQDDLNLALEGAGARLRAAGVGVAVLPLHPREDDAPASRLHAALPGAQAWRAGTPDEALARIAASRYVLSARLHGAILAAVAGIGFAGLVYDPKVAGFLEQARAPRFARDGDAALGRGALPVDPAVLARLALEAKPPEAGALSELRRGARDGLDWLAVRLRR